MNISLVWMSKYKGLAYRTQILLLMTQKGPMIIVLIKTWPPSWIDKSAFCYFKQNSFSFEILRDFRKTILIYYHWRVCLPFKTFITFFSVYFDTVWKGTARFATSSSCRGFSRGFFCPLGKTRAFNAVFFFHILGHFWCLVVTSVALSSNFRETYNQNS